MSEAFEPPAHASVRAVRSDLEDDPADQARVDGAGCLDRTAGGRLDRLHDRAGLIVRELVGGRELYREPVLGLRNERIEVGTDLRDLTGPSLLGDEAISELDFSALEKEQA